jgi:tetratricopeptide (TPR) repeat protein
MEADAATLRLGGGRFELKRRLGEGGFGIVYQAFDTHLNASVALKRLRRFDVAALYRLKREFRALADIDHPNLVSLYELFSGDDWFFTMELINGSPLTHFVARRRQQALVSPLASAMAIGPDSVVAAAALGTDTSQMRSLLVQIAEALCAIHGAGILHCDIKPSNVLVTDAGRAVLLDFGLATELSQRDRYFDFGAFGTPEYMSPEYGEGLPISKASDWYAFGIVLYELLTGVLPFRGTPLDILSRKLAADVVSPFTVVSDLPEDLGQLCIDLLQRDPTLRPSGEEVVRRLSPANSAASSVPAPAPPRTASALVGRRHHLTELHAAFDATSAGRPVVVRVQGPSGIGKTALVRRFLRQLRRDEPDAVVLTARCYEQESVPYKALDGIVDDLARALMDLPTVDAASLLPRDVAALGRLFPALRQIELVATAPDRGTVESDSVDLRRRAFTALRDLLGALADRHPLTLVIDDMQWSDLDSLALLGELLRPPDAAAFLLVVCHRSDSADTEPVRVLASIIHAAGIDARELAVDRLSPAATRRLATRLLEPFPAGKTFVRAIAEQSDGNPFFVHELVRYVAGGGTVVRLDQVLRARFTQLLPDALETLRLVALRGKPVASAIVSAAASGPIDLPAAVHQLRAHRFIRTQGAPGAPVLETSHDRIREAILSNVPEPTLAARHRRLAHALAVGAHPDHEAVAFHYDSAGESEVAGHHYMLAGDRAVEALAFNRAIRLYQRALDLQREVGAARVALKLKIADALANAGRGIEAARAYDEVAPDTPEPETSELRRRAAYHYAASGHVDAGNDAFRKVLAGAGMRLPHGPVAKLLGLAGVRARLLLRGTRFRPRDEASIDPRLLHRIDVAWSAGTGLGLIDLTTGWQFTSRALLHALEAGEIGRIARALAWDAATHASMSVGGQRRARRMLVSCGMLTTQLGTPYARAMLAFATALVEYCSGNWQYARSLFADAAETFHTECRGCSWELSTLRAFQLRNLLMLGEYPEVRRLASEALQRADQAGDLYYATFHGVFVEPHLRLLDDDVPGARHSITFALARWSAGAGVYGVQHALAAEMRPATEIYAGEGVAAHDTLGAEWVLLKKHFLLQNLVYFRGVLELRARTYVAAAARSQGRERERLIRGADADARRLERLQQPCTAPFVDVIRAGIAHLRGDQDGARFLLTRAAHALDSRGLRGLAAAAGLTLSLTLAGTEGDRLREAALTWMRTHDVARPDRFAALLIPGFD